MTIPIKLFPISAIRAMALGTTLLSPIAAGSQVHAFEEAADGGYDGDIVEEVTISATRTERPVFTTPSAVSVIDTAGVTRFQPLTYADVFEGLPGVAIQGGARRIAEEPNIRGFSDTQVVIRLDGARQNFDLAHRGRFFVDQDLVKRIEVVRGSASALYGSGALGGVISLETKGAKDLLQDGETLGGRVKTAYQSNGDELLTSASLFGQSGAFDAAGTLIYREVFNDLEDGSGETILDTEDQLLNGLVKLGFEPGEHHRFELIASIFDNEGENPTNANAVSTPTTVVDRETSERNLRGKYTYSDPNNRAVNLEAVAFYTSIDVSEDRFIDGRNDESDFESYGFDVHNTSRFNAGEKVSVALTYGVEYFRDSQSGTRNGGVRTTFPDAELDFLAGYAQAEIEIGDMLSIIPGLRWDSFDVQAGDDSQSRDEDEITPRVAVGFAPAEWVYLWGSYSEAFRTPSLTELFNDGTHFVVPNGLGPGTLVVNNFVPSPNLAPERAESWELGARFRQSDLIIAGDAFDFSATVFRSDVDDFVDQVVTFVDPTIPPAFTPPFGPTTFFGTTRNDSAMARIEGIEAELRYESDYVFFSVAGFTVDGENRDTGEGLGSMPQDSLTTQLIGKWPELGLQAGGRLTVASDQNDVPAGSTTTAGFETVDIFASWAPLEGALQGLNISLGIDNLFDETFSFHPTVIRQPGRSLRVMLSHRFGL